MLLSEGYVQERNYINACKVLKTLLSSIKVSRNLAIIDVLNMKIPYSYIWQLDFLPYTHSERKNQ